MSNEQGDTKAPLDFDSPDLSWADEPAGDAAPPPASETVTAPDADSDASPEPATTVPDDAKDAGDQDRQPKGPIPFDRHEAILANERKKREDLEAKWQRVQWAETLANAGKTPQQVQEALSLYDGIDSDPSGFLERFYDRLKDHPQLAPQVRSWAGRVLGGGRGQAAGGHPQTPDAVGDPEPQPDFQNEQGVPFYSGPQQQKWYAWRERQLDQRFQAALQPLLADRQQQQRQQAEREIANRLTETVKGELTRLREIPAFRDNEAKIKAHLQANGYRISLQEAFNHVLVTQVLPSLGQAERAKTLAELKTQAGASSVNPKAAAVKTPARPRDFDDPTLEW